MPIFEIEGPNGELFEVDAPDEGAAMSAFQQMSSPESPQSQDFRAELGGMTQNPARARYDALPEWQKPLVAASDVGQLTAKGAMNMVGLNPDKLAAGIRAPFTDKSYDEELSEQQRMTAGAQKRSGGAGTAAEIAGGVGSGLGLARQGLTLMGRAGTAAMTGVSGLAARSGLMAAEGAGYGAANAFANDQDLLQGAGIGALGGAGGNVLGEGISAGVSKVAGAFNKKPVVPRMDELVAKKDAAYKAADDAGVIFTPAAVDRVRRRVVDGLTDMGFDEGIQKPAARALKRIQDLAGQNVTLKGLDTIRKVVNNAYEVGNKSNNKAVSIMIDAIDDVIDKPGARDVLMGDQRGMKALQEARKWSSRVIKLEKVENLIKKGNQQADRNITDTRVRSVKAQLAKINDPFAGWGRGFTAAEKEAAGKASRYTNAQRALHGASVANPLGGGKLSAGGHLLLGATNVASGNLPGLLYQAAGAGAGAAAGKAGEVLANRSVKEFTDLIARGGVLPPQAQNAVQKLAKSERELLTRGILSLVLDQARQKTPAQ